MGNYIQKINSINNITHYVFQIYNNKPEKLKFSLSRDTQIAINKKDSQKQERSFIFIKSPTDNYLVFTNKTYPEKESVKNDLLNFKKDDEAILHDIFGVVNYNNKGVFIAAKAGNTPFISIFKTLPAKNKIGKNILLFSNKTNSDIILQDEIETIPHVACVNILADQQIKNCNFTQKFYKWLNPSDKSI